MSQFIKMCYICTQVIFAIENKNFIFQITKDFKHFEVFLTIWDPSVVNSWFISIPHFLIGLIGFFFLVVSFLGSLYILDISHLSDLGLVKILLLLLLLLFLQSVSCQFILLTLSFA
jgi:hypothetical protein